MGAEGGVPLRLGPRVPPPAPRVRRVLATAVGAAQVRGRGAVSRCSSRPPAGTLQHLHRLPGSSPGRAGVSVPGPHALRRCPPSTAVLTRGSGGHSPSVVG